MISGTDILLHCENERYGADPTFSFECLSGETVLGHGDTFLTYRKAIAVAAPVHFDGLGGGAGGGGGDGGGGSGFTIGGQPLLSRKGSCSHCCGMMSHYMVLPLAHALRVVRKRGAAFGNFSGRLV